MDDRFDPYHAWLGISAKDQPPHHYRLLGLEAFESDPNVIETAGDRQMAHVRKYQQGTHAAESQKLLNELSAAKLTLLVPEKKAAYDAELRRKQAERESASASSSQLRRARPLPRPPAQETPLSPPPNPVEELIELEAIPQAVPLQPIQPLQPLQPMGTAAWPQAAPLQPLGTPSPMPLPAFALAKPSVSPARKPTEKKLPLSAPILAAIGVAGVAFLCLLGTIVWMFSGGSGTIVFESPTPGAELHIKRDGAIVERLTLRTPKQALEIPAGEYEILAGPTSTEWSVTQSRVALKSGETKIVQLTRPALAAATPKPPADSAGNVPPISPTPPTATTSPSPSGTSLSVTVNGAAPAFRGSAIRFNGASSIRLSNLQTVIGGPTPMTIEVWARWPLSQSNVQQRLLGMGSPMPRTPGWDLQYQDARLKLLFFGPNGHLAISSGGPNDAITADWNHVAVSRDRNSRLHLHINGRPTEVQPVPIQIAKELGEVSLGSRLPTDQFRGLVRAFRFSSACRYETPFTPPAQFTADADTVSLFDFTSVNPGQILDVAGRGNHGKLAGIEWTRVNGDSVEVLPVSGIPPLENVASAVPAPSVNPAPSAVPPPFAGALPNGLGGVNSTPPVANALQPLWYIRLGGQQSVEVLGSASSASRKQIFTAEMWVRWRDTGNVINLLGNACMRPGLAVPTETGWNLAVRHLPGRSALILTRDNARQEIEFAGDSGWHHVAHVRARDAEHDFIDGRLIASQRVSQTADPMLSNLYLGASPFLSPDGMTDCDIAAFRLRGAEVYPPNERFVPPPTFEVTPDTLAHYDFQPRYQNAVRDSTGMRRHGLLNGAIWLAGNGQRVMSTSSLSLLNLPPTTTPLALAGNVPPGVVASRSGTLVDNSGITRATAPLAPTASPVAFEPDAFVGQLVGRQAIEINNTMRLPSTDYTAEMWARWGDDGRRYFLLGNWHDQSHPSRRTAGWAFAADHSGYRTLYTFFTGTTAYLQQAAQNHGHTWHHVAVMRRADNALLTFVDGQNIRTDQTVIEPSQVNMTIGAPRFAASSYYTAMELGAFRLSRGNIYQQASFTPPQRLEKTSETLALLDFSRALRSAQIPDSSGNGRFGLMLGSPQWVAFSKTGTKKVNTEAPKVAVASLPTTDPAPLGNRSAIPDEEARAKALEQVKQVFTDELAKAKKAPDKIALAKKLRQLGHDSKDDLASRYVLFQESLDLASDAGDFVLAMGIIRDLAGGYEVDAWKQRQDLVQRLAKRTTPPDAVNTFTQQLLELVDQAVKEDRFDCAVEAVSLAATVSQTGRDTQLKTTARVRKTEITALKEHWRIAQLAIDRLATDPENPKANQALGRFLCFAKSDWDKGLSYLAKADEAKFKTAAGLESAPQQDTDARLAVGDAWMDCVEVASGTERKSVLGRARHWYQLAASSSQGLAKLRAEKGLAKVTETLAKLTD